MTERIPIPKRIRFEIFKRDCFTCQYCGKKAPDVILHIDHIVPISKGGTNDILNLITSCESCNLGKSNIPLNDNSVVEKRRRQLELEQEAQEQREMLFEWHKFLQKSREDSIQNLIDYWEFLGHSQYKLTDVEISEIKKIRNSNADEEIIAAMDIAAKQYFIFENQILTQDSYIYAFSKLSGIIRGTKYEKDHPETKKLIYIRGILRKRIQYYYDDKKALEILKDAYYKGGLTIDELSEIAKRTKNWSGWKSDINQTIEKHLQ